MELPATTKDITVEWLNEVLHDDGLLGDTDIISIDKEQIGVGEGFMSDIVRLLVTYSNTASNLPKTMIAKMPTDYKPMREISIRRGVFEKEIRLYTEIVPKSPIRCPELYFSGMDKVNDSYVLLMQDCSNYELADPNQKGLSNQQLIKIASTLADFHARWWHNKDNPHPEITWIQYFSDFISDRYWGDIFHVRWEDFLKVEFARSALPKGCTEIIEKIVDQWNSFGDNFPSDNLTINHSDFKADNIFFDWEDKENPVVIFDWGSFMMGRGVADLTRLLATSVDKELRRQVEKEIIQLYHDRLVSNGIKGYSFDDCWNDYRKSLVIYSYFPILTFSINDYSNERAITHGRLSVDRWFTAILENNAVEFLS